MPHQIVQQYVKRLAAVVERFGWRKIITITKFYATLQEVVKTTLHVDKHSSSLLL